jgi:hypothetical protein
MNRKRPACVVVLLLIAASLGARQLAAQPKPTGPETRVDTEYDFYSISGCPQLAVAPDRSFEILWTSGSYIPTDARARHYNASGSPTNPREVAVSPLVDSESPGPILYTSALSLTSISTGFRALFEIQGPRKTTFFQHWIDPSGVPAPGGPRPVGGPDTGWVLPGPGDVLFAEHYDASLHRMSVQAVDPLGQPAGTDYILNTRPFTYVVPTIQPLSDGGWVAVFSGTSIAAPGSPAVQAIRARRFSAAGVPLGPDFDVNSVVPPGRPRPYPFFGSYVLVAAGPAGRFAVAWSFGSHASGMTIRLRFFDSAGVPIAPETVVVRDNALESLVSMASDDSGRVFLVWLRSANFRPNFATDDLRALLVGTNGSPVGPQLRVPSKVSSDWDAIYCGSVAWAGDSWLITWLGQYLDEDTAIFVRRFR